MKKIFVTAIITFLAFSSFGQMDTIINFCKSYIKYPFISDGQVYRALLNQGEIAEFRFLFFGGTTYRIIGATAPTKNSIRYRLYDKKRNLLFDSSEQKDATYWDFKFTSTVECFLEAELPPNKQSGFVIFLLGFKQN